MFYFIFCMVVVLSMFDFLLFYLRGDVRHFVAMFYLCEFDYVKHKKIQFF